MRISLKAWRDSDERIALVPTMGNLHAGHLHLVDQARNWARRVVVSIFVNPTQFGEGEDFEDYPRTLDRDIQLLKDRQVDLLFTPGVSDVYPKDFRTSVEVSGLSGILCGASRPGHFKGVATVVCKLFNMVDADVAVFGLKDYQQFIIIRKLARELNFPLEIRSVDTVREGDGLAMSSRNAYLNREQRNLAPKIYAALCDAKKAIDAGHLDCRQIEQNQIEMLESAGFRPDYFSVRRAEDLAVPVPEDKRLVILAAAWLGNTRLIDNVLAAISPVTTDTRSGAEACSRFTNSA